MFKNNKVPLAALLIIFAGVVLSFSGPIEDRVVGIYHYTEDHVVSLYHNTGDFVLGGFAYLDIKTSSNKISYMEGLQDKMEFYNEHCKEEYDKYLDTLFDEDRSPSRWQANKLHSYCEGAISSTRKYKKEAKEAPRGFFRYVDLPGEVKYDKVLYKWRDITGNPPPDEKYGVLTFNLPMG